MSDAMKAVIREYRDPRFFNRSEMRIRRNRMRRARELNRRIALLTAVCFLLIFIGFFLTADLRTAAHTEDIPVLHKYYTNVLVEKGDSLWAIAQKYINYDRYEDLNAYIAEVRQINRLSPEDDIRAGARLIVPYYAERQPDAVK